MPWEAVLIEHKEHDDDMSGEYADTTFTARGVVIVFSREDHLSPCFVADIL